MKEAFLVKLQPMTGKILHIYLDESEQNKALASKFDLSQTHLGERGWGTGESRNARKIIKCSPSSNFGNSNSST